MSTPCPVSPKLREISETLSGKVPFCLCRSHNPNNNSILMALTKRIDPDFVFGNWLAGKPFASLDLFYAKATQFLKKEDARRSRKQDDAEPSVECIQSSIAEKQTGESSGKVQLNVQNKQGQQKGKGKKRDPNHGPRPRAPCMADILL